MCILINSFASDYGLILLNFSVILNVLNSEFELIIIKSVVSCY